MSSSWAARVAGAATAMLLARLGHDVVVVDQASFPSDTVSTHAIARSGVVQLRRWGLLEAVLDSGAPAIRQVTFHAGGESVSRTIRHKAGVDLVVAPRRYVLDTIIAAAAQRAGADVRTGVTVTGVQRDGRGRVTGIYGHDRAGAAIDLGARYVIGADGLSVAGCPLGRRRDQRGPPCGRRGPVRLLRRHSVGWHGAVRGRAVVRRGVPDPRRAGVHLGRHSLRGRQGGPPPDRVARGGLRRAARAFRPAAGRAAAPRPPDLAGAGHAAPAQPGAPGIRPGLGAGRRCRLSP